MAGNPDDVSVIRCFKYMDQHRICNNLWRQQDEKRRAPSDFAENWTLDQECCDQLQQQLSPWGEADKLKI